MTDWLARADELLYDGEAVVETVRVDPGGVVVTTHRVLTFTPDRDGANFRGVDRPNVTGVTAGAGGEWGYLRQAIKALVVGGVLLVAGQTVSLDSLAGSVSLGGGTAQVGMGGVLGMLRTFLTLLAQLDELMTAVGALALLFGLVVLGVWFRTRERELVVSVAGDGEDLRLSAPDDAEDVARRLETAIQPG